MMVALASLSLIAIWLMILCGVARAVVVPGAQLNLHVGVGCQRGMARAQLVDDDGRLIEADHMAAGRASKMALHPKSVGPTSKTHKRKTPQEGPWWTTVGKSRGCNMPCVRTWPYQSRRNGSRVAGTGTDVGPAPPVTPSFCGRGRTYSHPLLQRFFRQAPGALQRLPSERLAASRDAGGCEHYGWGGLRMVYRQEGKRDAQSGRTFVRSGAGGGLRGRVGKRPRA